MYGGGGGVAGLRVIGVKGAMECEWDEGWVRLRECHIDFVGLGR